jgi:cytochrome c
LIKIAFGLLMTVGIACRAIPAAAQDADAGQRLFQQRCGACHQIATTRNGVGPHLQGIIGRAAGSVEGFSYSRALSESAITWDDAGLDAYLANPTAMVRGTRMTQRFNSAEERRAIIAFLNSH